MNPSGYLSSNIIKKIESVYGVDVNKFHCKIATCDKPSARCAIYTDENSYVFFIEDISSSKDELIKSHAIHKDNLKSIELKEYDKFDEGAGKNEKEYHIFISFISEGEERFANYVQEDKKTPPHIEINKIQRAIERSKVTKANIVYDGNSSKNKSQVNYKPWVIGGLVIILGFTFYIYSKPINDKSDLVSHFKNKKDSIPCQQAKVITIEELSKTEDYQRARGALFRDYVEDRIRRSGQVPNPIATGNITDELLKKQILEKSRCEVSLEGENILVSIEGIRHPFGVVINGRATRFASVGKSYVYYSSEIPSGINRRSKDFFKKYFSSDKREMYTYNEGG